jgi:hypothetical protein
MNKTILEFIISAVIASKDDQKTLGEEIRQLEETIGSIINREEDQILEVIYNVITETPNDVELASKIKGISPLILIALYVEENIGGDSDPK